MFKWLFGRSYEKDDARAAHEALLQGALDRMTAASKPAVRLTFTPGAPVPDDPVSSIGGRPSLRSAGDWLMDESGNPMSFLAQLNYADLPPLDGYPTRGLLSFFVKDDDLFGCEFPSKAAKGYRLIWEPEPDGLVRQEQPEMVEGYSPFGLELEKKGAPLRGVLTEGLPTPGSVLAEAIGRNWPKDFPIDLEDAFSERLMEAKPGSLYYGAHPDFTQSDFRHRENALYSEVLLQIGLVTPEEYGWQVMFGDAGEAQFMISPDDLAARAFEKAVWNWDCC